MAEGFEELGIRSELAAAARESGYEVPTTLQRAAVPVLRRGGNAVLHASAGAGVVAAYGLAVLDRLAEAGSTAGGEPRALVLTAVAESVPRSATSLARFGRSVGLRVAATEPGWAHPPAQADVVVATPGTALEAVRASLLKLDTIETLVLDGLAAIFSLGAQDAIETLTTSVPRDAQRVVVTAELTPEIDSYVERHVRRALNIPGVAREAASAAIRSVAYAVATERDRTDALAVLLAEQAPAGAALVYCRGPERAAAVAEALALRGFPTAAPGGEGAGITVTAGPTGTDGDALTISFDVPFDAETLAARHAVGGIVLVEPRELAHLRIIAGRAGFTLTSQPVTEPAPARDEIAAFRDRLQRALAEEDIGAQLLVLDPLFTAFAATEVAAAASALLRRRAPAAVKRAPIVPATAPAPPPAAYVRLFIGIGNRDGIRPGDLVGAITGEANVTGAEVGRIEIRESHSVVEVASEAAPRVIAALNGTTLRGRSLRVDYDRRPTAGAARGGREGAGERPGERPRRRPPRER